ncbi:helix-turn-helix transcriptional regulator [Paenibacillus sp. 1P03SA]|uniref:helix-turn-helix transcriptional regulator n=1 Tax=Paenibacillus sp. 1P03SA TaxID=3132294 RepID=UPI0039A3242B
MKVSSERIAKFASQYNLTESETKILSSMAIHGYSNDELGGALKLSVKTVNNHLGKIFSKTSCNSSRELLAKIIVELLPRERKEGVK